MAAGSAKGKQGTRYSAEQKAEILEFIEKYNAEHKRGGGKAASEKYGISVVTLSNWGSSLKKKKKSGSRKRVVRKKAPIVKAAPPQKKEMTADAILKRLQDILAEISSLEKEYNTLKKQL